MTTVAPTRADGRSLSATRAVRRPGPVRLVGVELRKTTDTRAGRWLLLTLAGLAVAGLGWRLWNAENSPVTFEHFFQTALLGVQLLLPVLGILAMTSEWTQRTALSTFTLVPRRGRVLAAKLVAAVVLALALVVLVAGLSTVAALVGGMVTGDQVLWGDVGRIVGGAAVASVLNVLMAAGFGAVLQQTAAAVVLYFVMPTLWANAAPSVLGESARWLDVYESFFAIARFDVSGVEAQSAVATAVWVVLPLAAGVVRSLRREVS